MEVVEPSDKQATFTFECREHCGTLLMGLDWLRRKRLLFDVTLLVDGKCFRAHRAVLAASSDYFRAMFTDPMKERQQEEIQLNGVSAVGLRHVLDYAYTSRLTLDLRNIQAVLSAASHLQILPVIGACADFLYTKIDLDNCVDIATISETFTLTHLRKHAYCFMGRHLHLLSTCTHYEFNQRLSFEQIGHLLSGDFSVSCSEGEVLEAVLAWLNADLASRWSQAPSLLSRVNLDEVPTSHVLAVLGREVPADDSVEGYTDFIDGLRRGRLSWHVREQETEAGRRGLVNVRGLRKALVVVGGFQSSTGATNALSYLHTGGRQWRPLTTIPHVDQFDFGAAVLGNRLYVTGGVFAEPNQETAVHGYCFCYDPCSDRWKGIASMIHDRCGHHLAAVDRRLYAIGGNDDGGDSSAECYDPAADVWQSAGDLPFEVERSASAVLDDERVYVSGGVAFFTGDLCDSVWCFHAPADRWTPAAAMLVARADHGMVATSGRLYVGGGWTKAPVVGGPRVLAPTLDVYDPNTDQWQTVSQLPSPRYLASLSLSGGRFYLTGGRRLFGGLHGASAKVDVYDPETDEWTVEGDYPVEIWEHHTCELYIPVTRDQESYRSSIEANGQICSS